MAEYLFSDGSLREFLEERKNKLIEKIQNRNREDILNVDPEKYCDYLYQEYKLEVPQIEENSIETDLGEEDILQHDNSYKKGTKISIIIPFKGDSELFRYVPSQHRRVEFKFNVSNHRLIKVLEGIDLNAGNIKKDLSGNLGNLKTELEYISRDVSGFNENLKNLIEKEIEKRKKKLLEDEKLISELGFPSVKK